MIDNLSLYKDLYYSKRGEIMKILILSGDDVRRALPMQQAIGAMKRAFTQLSRGQADVPLREALRVPRHRGVTLFMPAYLASDDQMAVKIASVFEDNPAKGLPLIHSLVVMVDTSTGEPCAVMDGAYLTALRTGRLRASPRTCWHARMPRQWPSSGRVHRGAPSLRQSVPYAKSRGPGCTIRYQTGPPPL